MELSHQNKKVYDLIRKKWVDAFPEEIVRQKIIRYLVESLGYPPYGIVIEKKISELPFLFEKDVPSRRIDILCLESETLSPLLLIECKAIPLKEEMFSQPLGYNAFIQAPLICLANERDFLLRWEKKCSIQEKNQLPSYEQLRNT